MMLAQTMLLVPKTFPKQPAGGKFHGKGGQT